MQTNTDAAWPKIKPQNKKTTQNKLILEFADPQQQLRKKRKG
jgi:hypothetical protein